MPCVEGQVGFVEISIAWGRLEGLLSRKWLIMSASGARKVAVLLAHASSGGLNVETFWATQAGEENRHERYEAVLTFGSSLGVVSK